MNKRVDIPYYGRYYSTLLLVLVLYFMGSCASTHRERMLEEIADGPEVEMQNEALEAQFKAERLSAEELKAFERRAIQKLEDFSDYVNLLADPGLDSVFRQQAVRQAQALFVDEQAEVVLYAQSERVGNLLQHSGNERQETTDAYSIQDIEVKEPLQPTTAREYRGALTFHQQWVEQSEEPASRKASILARKVLKSFGNKEEWVWEVLIERIE